MTMWRHFLFSATLGLFAAMGCTSEDGAGDGVDGWSEGRSDAGAVNGKGDNLEGDGVVGDMAGDAERDPDTEDPAAERPRRVTVELVDGRFAAGEIVAVYDRTRWWNPGVGGLVYAIFDPDRYGFGETDRSFTFVTSDEVSEIVAMEPVTTSYREFLTEQGFEFVRSPFNQPTYVVMGNDGYHLDEDGFGDYAFDLQITDEQGRRFSGTGAANTDHFVWDEPAFAPIAGTLFETYGQQFDNPPGSYPEGAPNNLVGIRLGGNFYAYLLHFREDGLEPGLTPGADVRPGDRMGRIGNSGVTLEPHLHLVVLWYDPVGERSYSVPAQFSAIEVSPTPTGPWRTVEGAIPDTGVWIR